MPFPEAPRLSKRLSLARLSDLERVALVAAAGFFHSNVFQYERPFFKEHVNDTLASYRDEYAKAIMDPNVIVLVCRDEFQRSEVKHVYAALAEVYPYWKDQLAAVSSGNKSVIVGVASLSFQANSPRKGQFQPDATNDLPTDPDLQDQDKSEIAGKLLNKALHEDELSYLAGRMVVDTIVVHPAYWRRGHATSLVKYFTEMAEIERVGIGVSAATMGVLLFKHLGYEEAKNVEVPGYPEHPKPIEVWIGLNKSTSTKSNLSIPMSIWYALTTMLQSLCGTDALIKQP